MSEVIHIPPNVWEFIDVAASAVGRMEQERFEQEMHSRIVETHLIESPIEQIFLVALHTLARAHFEEINPEPVERNGVTLPGWGIQVTSQFQVEKYGSAE